MLYFLEPHLNWGTALFLYFNPQCQRFTLHTT